MTPVKFRKLKHFTFARAVLLNRIIGICEDSSLKPA